MKHMRIPIIFLLVLGMGLALGACKQTAEESATDPTTTPAPTTTAAPTTTEPEETIPTEPIITLVDMLGTYYSVGMDEGWHFYVNSLGDTNVGKQYIRFTVTPESEKFGGLIGFADTEKEVEALEDLAFILRMNKDGFFDAGNGDSFEKLNDAAYSAGNTYLVEIEADMEGKTFNAFITGPGEEKVMIAENYAFKSTASLTDDLGKFFLITEGDTDDYYIERIRRLVVFEPGKSYISKGENFGWQQNGIYPGKVYTGKLKIDFDMTCLVAGIDGSVDFTDIDIDVIGFGDLAMLVRMAGDYGYFDVRNFDQGQQCLVQVPYTVDVPYHIEITCDMDEGIYSVWVTPPDGERTMIAEDYRFRVTATHAKNVGQVYVISRHASDQLKLENLVIVPR